MAARRPPDRRVHRSGRRASSSASTPSRSRCSSSPTCSVCRRATTSCSASELGAGSSGQAGRSAAPAEAMAHSPLEFLYEQFTDVHRGPPAQPARRRDDRSGDRDVPRRFDPRGHRRRADRRQPLRRRPGDDRAALRHRAAAASASDPDLQQLLRDAPRAHPELRRGVACAIESPVKGDFRLSRVPTTARWRRHPGRHHGDGRQRGRQPRSRDASSTPPSSRSSAPTHASTSRSATARTPARVRRSPAPRDGSASSGSSTGWTTSGSPRSEHGPVGARRYDYVPTYILRGVSRLYLEFEPRTPG